MGRVCFEEKRTVFILDCFSIEYSMLIESEEA